MSQPTTMNLVNKGLLLQNGEVIQEEPEEEENGSLDEESEEDIDFLQIDSTAPSFNKAISTVSIVSTNTIGSKICGKILNELIDIVIHSMAE